MRCTLFGRAHTAEHTMFPASIISIGMAGELILIGTPLGNLADISRRVTDTLAHVDILYCEDTRVTGKLLNALGITCATRPLSDDHGIGRVQEAVQAVLAGKRVGYASDAGMPGVSDPGRRLVEEAWRAGVAPTVVPGPSAVATWVAVCPFVEHGFEFAGYAPRKPGERAQFAEHLARSPLPVLFFESPHRVHELLEQLTDAVEPDRQFMVGREMTKLFEQFVLFTANQWDITAGQIPAQGEFTVGIAGREQEPEQLDALEIEAALSRLREAGFSNKDAAKALAAVRGLKPNEIKRLGFDHEQKGGN